MDSLILTISKLQDVFATIGSRESEVQLPQIVVVGSQSTGKSSVIEGIVGRDLLPRGAGIVTRRPLLLHLNYVPLNSPMRDKVGMANEEWAEFAHKPDEIYTDFEKVRAEIEAETERLTGTDKGISPIAINLSVFSDKVVNLSLIDLPGLTTIPVGDQPADIETQIRQMVLTYITNPNSVILAVTPANQDFATSEAIKIAREVDKDGDRTLAVLTKLDLMDKGTDAMDVLTNKLVPMKLGIIGVVSRSQQDINENKSIRDCLKDEKKFLSCNYPALAKVNGIEHLAKTLNRLLMNHIHKCLPDLKLRVSTMILQRQNELLGYGEPMVDKSRTLLQLITHFSNAYISTLEGTVTTNNIDEKTKLCGGSQISHIFHEILSTALEKLDPMESLSTHDIITAIRISSGLKPALFVPEASFELLVKRQIRRLEEPSMECVDRVYEELLRIIQYCGCGIQAEIERFPRVFGKINEVVSGMLSGQVSPTKQFVTNFFRVQLAYVNIKHPEFASDAALIKVLQELSVQESAEPSQPVAQTRQQPVQQVAANRYHDPKDVWAVANGESDEQELSWREIRDCTLIERLVKGYFAIVRKSIQDMVPKTIMSFLIDYIRDNLQCELVRQLYNTQDMNMLLAESEMISQKRAESAEMLEALTKANKVINEIRDTHWY